MIDNILFVILLLFYSSFFVGLFYIVYKAVIEK